ncbi:type II toxin-antitoxin system RelE/ParE family toxin [Aggregatibacter actinomycetemcomitans]|nr:type II toxin-antitoxin system RelE/ParE family toxin [Aggregatibacter actinomycetemcomitans]
MHKIIYSENAVQDFEHIVFDLTEYAGFSSAITIFEDIKQTIELLAYMPLMGVTGRVEGTREIYVRGYRIVYRVSSTEIQISTIIHCKRLYPNF